MTRRAARRIPMDGMTASPPKIAAIAAGCAEVRRAVAQRPRHRIGDGAIAMLP
jgi:hypothetical protein